MNEANVSVCSHPYTMSYCHLVEIEHYVPFLHSLRVNYNDEHFLEHCKIVNRVVDDAFKQSGYNLLRFIAPLKQIYRLLYSAQW